MLDFGQNRACEGEEIADEEAFQRGTDDRSADASIGRYSRGGGDPEPGIGEQTFYRRKAKYAGLEVYQIRQMAQLQGGEFGFAAKAAANLR